MHMHLSSGFSEPLPQAERPQDDQTGRTRRHHGIRPDARTMFGAGGNDGWVDEWMNTRLVLDQ